MDVSPNAGTATPPGVAGALPVGTAMGHGARRLQRQRQCLELFHARPGTYRWGEDGLGGISDDQQILCFALALWNGKDPIRTERLFGLTNSEGNHREDMKGRIRVS